MQSNVLRVAALALACSVGGLTFSSDAAACTTDAWTNVTGGAIAGSPTDVARYSGECGMQAALAGTSFVWDNSPNGTTDGAANPYRARFYVYTGTAATSPKIFSATSGDDGGGSEAVGITRTSTGFSFAIPGTTIAPFAATGGASAFDNKWYGIEIFYQEGQSFTASIKHPNGDVSSLTSAGAVSAGPAVSSALLGIVGNTAATSALAFDDFESTRSAASAIGFLLRSDANGDNVCDASDLSGAAAEILGSLLGVPNLVGGQPDCNGDGAIDASDLSCSASIILNDLLNGTTCGL